MASPPHQPLANPLAEALRENDELRRCLAEAQKALDQHVAAAATASEQLQQFLYAASHDLQEPLRGILSYAQLLERQVENDPTAHEYATFVVGGALRMRELLQRVLAYSRAGTAKQHGIVSLNVSLQMALMKLAPEIQASTAQIARTSMPEVIGNEGEIAQLFENVLRNALQYRSEANPEIAITTEQGIEECTIRIKDNGAGIDPRFGEQVFLPFKRLHSNAVAAGSGLGLAICSKIVRAHRGRIWVESDGVHGACVCFTLPS